MMEMQYPLEERIGDPDLFVGRTRELAEFSQWIDAIPRKRAKSRVILARRKSGKTVFMQRLFNKIWNENALTIPFYFNIQEVKTWFPDFAIKYYKTFASHCISFLERDPIPVMDELDLDQIKAYGESHQIKMFVNDVNAINNYQSDESHSLLWDKVYRAPERFAKLYNRRVLVMIDEIQNITQYIYPDKERKTEPDRTMAGSFHEVVESKIAPMLVSGSYVGWIVEIISQYLQAGRLKRIFMSPYLEEPDGLLAVYKYANADNYPITHENALLINRLCMSDPFFISCVIQSQYPEKDFSDEESVLKTVNYEICNKESELSMTWGEYIEQTVKRINDTHAKKILLHMCQNNETEFTPTQLKDELKLSLSPNDIQQRLQELVKADLINEGASDIRYKGLKDGTLNLVLRNRFQEEIMSFAPKFVEEFRDEVQKLKKDKKILLGKLSQIVGKTAELQLMTEFRSKKRFQLSAYFDGVSDTAMLNIIHAASRFFIQRSDGKNMEIDVIAESDCGRVILVEVKKMSTAVGQSMVSDFLEKIDAYSRIYPEKIILKAFFSLNGFTDEALTFCKTNQIAVTQRLKFML